MPERRPRPVFIPVPPKASPKRSKSEGELALVAVENQFELFAGEDAMQRFFKHAVAANCSTLGDVTHKMQFATTTAGCSRISDALFDNCVKANANRIYKLNTNLHMLHHLKSGRNWHQLKEVGSGIIMDAEVRMGHRLAFENDN